MCSVILAFLAMSIIDSGFHLLAYSIRSSFKSHRRCDLAFHSFRTQAVFRERFVSSNQKLNARRAPTRREDFYSTSDVRFQDHRRFPPRLDSLQEDEEYGGYDDNLSRTEIDLTGDIHLDQFTTVQQIEIQQSQQKLKPSQATTELSSADFTLSKNEVKSVSHTPPQENVVLLSPQHDVDSLEHLHEKIERITREIFALNNDKEFNLNSSKQVSQALFSGVTQSVNKDVLERLEFQGNQMAKLILQYRSLKNQINYKSRNQENVLKGTVVENVKTVVRPRLDPSSAQDTVHSDNKSNTIDTPMDLMEERTTFLSHHEEVTDPLILLDASSYIYRAYYTMPAIHRSDGMPVGAVMGFCKMLNSIFLPQMLTDDRPPRAVLCFDASGKTFRHDMYPLYKKNRPPVPMDLIPQFELIRQAAQAYGIHQIDAPNYEADDVIATLAHMAIKEGLDTNIISGDKDLMQLITHPNETSPSIQMIDPVKKDRTTYYEVLEKWSVPPNKLGDVLALAGDTADNIPGVPGIGPKVAALLINEFGCLDNLLENLNKIPQKKRRETLEKYIDQARLSRTLVELNRNVPEHDMKGFPENFSSVRNLRMEPINPQRMFDFYEAMGFKELPRILQEKLKGRKLKKPSSFRSKRPKAVIPKPEDYADVPF